MADDGWRLGYRPGLDQMRGVAVLAVVVAHGLSGLGVQTLAAAGVSAFFVLSGFLITRLLIEERMVHGRIRLRAFLVRRIRRLLPALVVAVPLFAAANVTLGRPIARPMVAAATYTSNFLWLETDMGAFTHLWSLAVEEHFYLVWPLVVSLVPLRVVPWVAAAGAIASAVSRVMFAAEGEAYVATVYRVDAILIGAVLAFLITRAGAPSSRAAMMSAALILLFTPAAMWDSFVEWGITVTALGSAVLVARSLTMTQRRPWLERLGQISYGVYLLHYPILMVMHYRLDAPVVITLATTVLGGVLLAELSWRVVESRWVGRRPAGHPNPSPPTVGRRFWSTNEMMVT